jgi:two-component system chemotaxis response regulator CheY
MGKKILVIDDSRTVRQQLAIVLTEARYEVVEASDGVEGAEAINGRSDLAMVICDVNLPRLNGIDMLVLLKKDPRHAELPVLMLTTESQAAAVSRARQAGARAWIVKPFENDLLLSAVRQLAGHPT